MRARVVYESMFGNTAAIATAIAQGLGEHAEVEILSVAAAAATPDPMIDLLVVGGPTHVFGLSRLRTRRAADAQTDMGVVVDIGIREWLDAALPVPRGRAAAAFGTKTAQPSWLPGSAARGAGKRLQHLGYALSADPMDFLVEGTKGPLRDGELERAHAWAERLARTELDRIAQRV
ncbi:flavodoxin domain-containing protein [Nocardia sp. XZ_19_231]|uniref:flavodoxin domain-containing protein n=1 Tax=Nocardia sp. XZ_19_231 TaxID=2769252 RepID=UPI00188DE058|nr:flavodoxin domain-containing protein [Nocardia sp. XZ_19_231]